MPWPISTFDPPGQESNLLPVTTRGASANACRLPTGLSPTLRGTGKRIREKGDKTMQRLSRHVSVETDVDTVVYPRRPNIRRPLVDLLRDGPLSSQTIEDALAKRFCVTEKMRAALLQNNCPAWRN